MDFDIVYILHKNGADSHYTGLQHLLNEKNKHLAFREFSAFSKLLKSLFALNFNSLKKQITNIKFLISLLFTKDKKIVLGIAPFDPKLKILLQVLKSHRVYYHTSWTCWDKTFQPKSRNMSPKVLEAWRFFLEDKVEHIFAVTNTTKNELLKNYALKNNDISVVYHSLNPVFTIRQEVKKRNNSFLYVGRLAPQKGLAEILHFFSENKQATLTIIGSGNEKALVQKYTQQNDNISYNEFISKKEELIKKIAQHEYLLLNSKKTAKWEELFGLVIIECMSQGVIPIAAMHSGPKEIISEETGILFEENRINTVLPELIAKDFNNEMSAKAEKSSKMYLPENIAKRWDKILNN